MGSDDRVLTVGEAADRTGVSPATLRMWERRHGFPSPERGPGGQRRYREQDCAQVVRVLAEREAGLSLGAAIARVRAAGGRSRSSVYAELRRRAPALTPSLFTRRTMIGLSHAVEDECSLAGDEPVIVGAFQDETAYHRSESRWRALASGATTCVVYAELPCLRRPRGGPVEVPFLAGSPMRDQWLVACHGPGFTACLAAWERPVSTAGRSRVYEAVWTVDRGLTALAIEVALEANPVDAELATDIRSLLERPLADFADTTESAVRLANRMLAYTVGAAPGP